MLTICIKNIAFLPTVTRFKGTLFLLLFNLENHNKKTLKNINSYNQYSTKEEKKELRCNNLQATGHIYMSSEP